MIDYNRLRQVAKSKTKWEQVNPGDVKALLESHNALLVLLKGAIFVPTDADRDVIMEAIEFHE